MQASVLAQCLLEFPNAVLTVRDADGYPFSLRCLPWMDATGSVRLAYISPRLGIRPGPASLLCHAHDRRLWNLRGFVVRGVVLQDPTGWFLLPEQVTEGAAMGGSLLTLRMLLAGWRGAHRFFRRYQATAPAVPWEKIRAVQREAATEKAQP